ncbi:MAG: TRAP transporter small permease subunit [Alphaproteobacteria bacterium]|nr:TRAP transporter small permease subunit [Alphaproteobacteria bacterium]MDX5370498.1 TRAP transporter small permease subunit [Alphaproteobacteria bacterium]MDX5464997.1 TRAP transporter small permease subunit [Alphaproteobacteria bacterium]
MSFLEGFARTIDRLNETIGATVAWLALPMVLLQFLVVLLRYVFGYGHVAMQESIVYLHAAGFMLGAAAVLLRGGHVRVDIFYSARTMRGKAMTDLFGALFFLVPMAVLIIDVSLPIAIQSWSILEGSKETSGIQAVFLLKSLPVAFATLVLLQGLSMAARAALVLTGRLDTHLSPAARKEGAVQ